MQKSRWWSVVIVHITLDFSWWSVISIRSWSDVSRLVCWDSLGEVWVWEISKVIVFKVSGIFSFIQVIEIASRVVPWTFFLILPIQQVSGFHILLTDARYFLIQFFIQVIIGTKTTILVFGVSRYLIFWVVCIPIWILFLILLIHPNRTVSFTYVIVIRVIKVTFYRLMKSLSCVWLLSCSSSHWVLKTMPCKIIMASSHCLLLVL